MKVATFNEFNGDNDPYGEHDCAMFEVAGQKFMFKIDYYDKDIKYGAEVAKAFRTLIRPRPLMP